MKKEIVKLLIPILLTHCAVPAGSEDTAAQSNGEMETAHLSVPSATQAKENEKPAGSSRRVEAGPTEVRVQPPHRRRYPAQVAKGIASVRLNERAAKFETTIDLYLKSEHL